MTNIERARQLIERVRAAGVEDFCICAGSRNSPLIAVLGGAAESSVPSPRSSVPPARVEGNREPRTEDRGPFNLFSFVDERSAAFFALGRAKQGRCTAVVTTSGTAVGELLPATIEAHYSATPLVLITADRPSRFRGSGAPQAIDQIGLFGPYAATSLDGWTRTTPLHLNIEFDEPLIDE